MTDERKRQTRNNSGCIASSAAKELCRRLPAPNAYGSAPGLGGWRVGHWWRICRRSLVGVAKEDLPQMAALFRQRNCRKWLMLHGPGARSWHLAIVRLSDEPDLLQSSRLNASKQLPLF